MPHGAINRLAEAVGASLPTVRKALRYQEGDAYDETTLARKIRWNAITHFGGIDSGAADVKVVEDVWTWDYANGARLAINFKTGLVTITFDGRVIDTADSIPTAQIYNWQLKAENLKAA